MSSFKPILTNKKIVKPANLQPHLLGIKLKNPNIICKVDSGISSKDWFKAGYITPIIDVPVIGKVDSKSFLLPLGTRLFTLNTLGYTYDLKIQVQYYLENVLISIWEYTP